MAAHSSEPHNHDEWLLLQLGRAARGLPFTTARGPEQYCSGHSDRQRGGETRAHGPASWGEGG